jgi:hypothetical protein
MKHQSYIQNKIAYFLNESITETGEQRRLRDFKFISVIYNCPICEFYRKKFHKLSCYWFFKVHDVFILENLLAAGEYGYIIQKTIFENT